MILAVAFLFSLCLTGSAIRHEILLDIPRIIVGLTVLTAIWAAVDSGKREMKYDPLVIGVGVLLIWIVVFPLYLARRQNRIQEEVDLEAYAAEGRRKG